LKILALEVVIVPNRPFYILDVFAEEKYAGNQLGVVRNAEDLSEDEMQKIANEMNYSETTFILSEEERDGGYDVRIFTPAKEVPFAGHPTLGTAYLIQSEILKKPVEKVVLNLKVGQIPVTFVYKGNKIDVSWMHQKNPSFGQIFEPDRIAQMLGLGINEIDERFPILEVSTGLPFIIVPLKTLNSVQKCKIDKDEFFKNFEKTDAKAILIFSPETYYSENDLNARVFAHYYGVPEDPATGSANGCLAAYLVKNRYFGKSAINIRVEQGYEIPRHSLLLLKAEGKDDEISIYVGGRVIMVAEGTLL
jgi:trans-2,3-dihydro-3-hydroxyanthranilate isomerase